MVAANGNACARSLLWGDELQQLPRDQSQNIQNWTNKDFQKWNIVDVLYCGHFQSHWTRTIRNNLTVRQIPIELDAIYKKMLIYVPIHLVRL